MDVVRDACLLQRLPDRALIFAPVGQSGQRIVRGLMLEFPRRFACRTDVVGEDQHRTQGYAITILDGCGGFFNRKFALVTIDVQQALRWLGGRRLGKHGMHPADKGAEVLFPAPGTLRRPDPAVPRRCSSLSASPQLIHILLQFMGVDGDDTVTNRTEGHLGTLLLLNSACSERCRASTRSRVSLLMASKLQANRVISSRPLTGMRME